MSSYFSFSNPLTLLHAAIWITAVVAGGFLHGQVRRLRRTTATVRAITESEYRRLAYPVEKFDTVFDLCASAFILIGLAGTILGFLMAVPYLRVPNYDFNHFRAALAVSAFGIAWSLLLHGLIAIYRITVISPALEALQHRQSAEQLATMLAKALSEVTNEIANKLGGAINSFLVAANRLGAASNELSASSRDAGATFKSASGELTRSAEAAVSVQHQVRALPSALAERLKATFDDHAKAMADVFETQRQDLQQSRDVTRAALDRYFAATHGRYVQQLEKDVEAAAAAGERAVASIARWADEFATGLKRMQKRIPDEVHQAHRDALLQVAAAAKALAEADQRHAALGGKLEAAGDRLEPAIARFSSAASTLAEALARLDGSRLAAMNQKRDPLGAREPPERPKPRPPWYRFGRRRAL